MRIIGRDQLGTMFGVTAKTISAWQDDGLPVAERGGPNLPNQYDSATCIAWYLQRELNRLQVETPRDRVFRLQAEELEDKKLQRRGALIPAALIEPKLAAVMRAASEQLQAVAARIGALIGDKVVEAKLRAEHRDFLNRMAEWRDGEEGDTCRQGEAEILSAD